MKIDFQNHETSDKFFRKGYKDPENFGDKLPCRRLSEEFWFEIDGTRFTVLPGFWWDGASIPKALQSVIGGPWEEDISPGCLIHDVLYGTHWFPRGEADKIMYEVNKLNGMGWWKNHTVYSGLYVGGGPAYKNKTREQLEGVRKHVMMGDKKMFDFLVN